MSGLSDKPGAGARLGHSDSRVIALEAENARLRAALAELSASSARESQIRLVADSLPVLIAYVDADQRFRFNNRAYESWFGMRRRDMFGRHLRDVLGDEAFETVRPLVERALAGEQVSAECDLVYKDGTARSIHIDYVPDRRDDGCVAGYFSLVQDISDARRAEAELRESEARFRAMADCAPAPVWVTNRDGVEFVNRAMVEATGLAADQLTGEAWMGLIHPDDLPQVLEKRAAAWAAGGPYAYEARFRRADGKRRWMHVSCSPRRDEDGRLIGYVGMAIDVHDRKRVEAELRESEARFRAMADSAPSPVWVTNEGGIDFANQALCAFTGLSVDALVGDAWMGLCHSDDVAAVQAIRTDAWRRQAPYEFEARFRRHDGEWRWLRANCKPRESAGAFVGYVGMAVDVTESHRAEAELRAREALLQAMFDNAGVGMVLMDGQCRIARANAAYCAIVGRSLDELIGTSCLDFTYPADLSVNREALTAMADGADAYAFEKRYVAADGRLIWVRLTLSNVGEQVLAIIEDVTARKLAEEALRESEERLRIALSAGALGDWVWDAGSDMLTFSEQAATLFGTPPGPVISWSQLLELMDPSDATGAAGAVQDALDGRHDFDIEYRVPRSSGAVTWVNATGRPIYDEAGRPKGMIGVVQDVTARKQAEQRLREDKKRLETLNRVGAALAAELDLERVVQMVTDAGVELSGAEFGAFFYNVEDESGERYMLYTLSGVDRGLFETFPMPRNTAVFAPTFTGKSVVRSDDITKDPRYGRNDPHHGMPKDHLPVCSYLAVPVVSRSGEVIGGLFFGHPEPARFTELHETLLIGIAGQAAIAIDNARLFTAAQREIGERSRAQAALAELNQSLEARISAAVAEREHAEAALRQAQKMEAVGQLTGGIAHDFNNLLTVIAGNLDLAERRLGPTADPRILHAITNALVGAERAATLTQRLLAFSRRQPLSPKLIDPNALISGVSELIHRTLGETVAVESRFGAVGMVEVDPHQLESALLNLAVNARDAMPEGGQLILCTRTIGITPAAASDDLPAGDYVRIGVTDTGHGMSADTVARAIEPFFTTKDVGKGTGLGLSMVYGFVKQSGGHLKIDSEEGQGTRIDIFLPCLAGEGAEAQQARDRPPPRAALAETILVCEDDAGVRAFTAELLDELGYVVLEAQDAAGTLAILGDPERQIDLLFTDVVLPGGMSGAVLAGQARALRPDLKILYTTGYARDAIVHDGRLDPGIELLPKPFAAADLAARLRDLLDPA